MSRSETFISGVFCVRVSSDDGIIYSVIYRRPCHRGPLSPGPPYQNPRVTGAPSPCHRGPPAHQPLPPGPPLTFSHRGPPPKPACHRGPPGRGGPGGTGAVYNTASNQPYVTSQNLPKGCLASYHTLTTRVHAILNQRVYKKFQRTSLLLL